MMRVILYTTGCPKCSVLEKKLDAINIAYEKETNEDVMMNKGFMSAPMLEVDGKVMDFVTANKWINNQGV